MSLGVLKLCKGSLPIDFTFLAETSKTMLCTFFHWCHVSHPDKVIGQQRQQYFIIYLVFVHGS